MSRIRRIIHPTDFSRASTPAFARGVAMARSNRAELVILHVMTLPMPLVGDGYVAPQVYEQIEASTRADAQKRLRALVKKAGRAGARAKAVLMEGVAHQRIAQAARSRRADLIVIGTHGRSGIVRFVLGSVAARVLAIAPCPVLTVRARAG